MTSLLETRTHGFLLTRARFNAGLTKRELARRTGVTPRTIANIEAGQRPSPQTAKTVADFFGVKPTDLFSVGE